MNDKFLKVKPFISKIVAGSITKPELNEFIFLCRSIAKAYIIHFRYSASTLCGMYGLDLDDLITDFLAEIYVQGESNTFPQIEKYVESLNTKLDEMPEIEVFLSFKSFLICIINAQIAKNYKQYDPSGSRIHRNIRDCLKDSPLFKLEKDFRGYVLIPRNGCENNHLPPRPFDELEQNFFTMAEHSAKIPELLETLYHLMDEQQEYRKSLTFIDVVQLFKKFHYDSFEPESNGNHICLEGLQEFEINHLRNQVEIVLQEKIVSYLLHGKINRKAAEAMFLSIKDMITDWCEDGESHNSIFKYLYDYLPMTEELYNGFYRTKMEYLVKIAKEEFSSLLLHDL